MGRLDNKIALISGGARGQGASEALLFAREGAKVIFGDVLDDLGKETERSIRDDGGDAVYVHLDVTSQSDWNKALTTAEEKFGIVDILVNNAGINLTESDKDSWDKVLNVNLHGAHLGIQTSIPFMKRAGGGSIVNISSVAGLIGRKGSPYSYTASKGAIRILSKAIAVDYAQYKIRCNTIIPGPVDTAMMRGIDPKIMEQRLSEIPLGRYATTYDIAFATLFLASDESAWMTGAEIVVDGGITAQ
jgi:NAD(P)-dependent dehydrogenase (short-subunit alcohol dehydrogenase family)